MAGTMDILVREMTMEDYDQVYKLWTKISGFRIRSIDDSREGWNAFKAESNHQRSGSPERHIIGNILADMTDVPGFFYHVCVEDSYRHHGVGYKMVRAAIKAMQKEGVSKISLVAFKDNHIGNAFWQGIGWTEREDFNSYEFILNEENIIRFVK